MDKESGIDSSLIRADYSLIRAEINPGFSAGAPDNAIVHESSSSANNAEVRHISVASLFRSQSKENSPSASPLRARNSKSPVEDIDPKEVPADPRFVLTKDIEDAIDLSQEEGEYETHPETLLHGHFKVLYDKGELNTVEEVKAAYMRVLGNDDCNVTEDFLYDLTRQLYQCADPFGTTAHNFAVAQKLMIDEQRTHYRDSMRKLQVDLKKMSQDHLQVVSKRMRETCEAKDKELSEIKAELRRLTIAHTLLVSQHAVLNLKTSQGGAEGYSQLQKDHKDLQAKYKAKKEECTLFEQQYSFLFEAFQEQSMVLPSRAPMSTSSSAPAPAPPDDDLDLECPIASRAREKLAHDNSGLNASWGNTRKPASVHDDGWGSAPINSRKPASVHDDGWLSAPSPQPTMDGSHTGLSDSNNSRPHQSGTVYG